MYFSIKIAYFAIKWTEKKNKVQAVWTTEGLSYFKFGGGVTIQKIAIKNKKFELLARINDVDLFSKGAMYHANCRKSLFGTFQLGEDLTLRRLITKKNGGRT